MKKKQIPKEEKTPVYFRLEYRNALESKKEVLSTEVNLINLMKTIKRFNDLRSDELKVRLQLYKIIKSLNLSARKISSSLPVVKTITPKIIAREETFEEIPAPKEEKFDASLESQLRDIQERLRHMNR